MPLPAAFVWGRTVRCSGFRVSSLFAGGLKTVRVVARAVVFVLQVQILPIGDSPI